LDEKNSHGTACAALAAASGNGACSVGMAPDATLSGCRIIGGGGGFDTEGDDKYFYLYGNQENMDISSNSYGIDACHRQSRRRHLQSCPFSQADDDSPCGSKSACTDSDWSVALSASCQRDIARYCSVLTSFEKDVEACTSYLDLFVKCDYRKQDEDELAALTRGVTDGRGGKGMIYMFAAGNEFDSGEDVNFEATLNSRFTIR